MITFFVIYDHPRDFPNEFVGRRQFVNAHGQLLFDNDLFARGPTIDDVRCRVPPGCIRFARADEDDPVIVETWMQ